MNANTMWWPVLGAVALFLLSPATQAQIYKWVDERGVTQYSDTPPANTPTTETLDIATTGYGAAAESQSCQTIRCQYERLRDDRLADEKQAQLNAQSRASVIMLEPAAPLSSRPTFSTGTRWNYGGFGYRRWAPAPFGIAPFGHAPQALPSAPVDHGTRLRGLH